MEMLSIQGLNRSPSTKSPAAMVTAPTRMSAFLRVQPNRFWSASTGLSKRFIHCQEEDDGKKPAEWDAPDDRRDRDKEKSGAGIRIHSIGKDRGDNDQP